MSLIIYLISFLEGFTTLSIEIIAIRNFTPIIGTNSISTSIILGVILLALSYGYYIGGKNSKNLEKEYLEKKIIKNLTIASIYYLFFTFTIDTFLMVFLLEHTSSYILSILLSSVILFFIPVFLASQTIPLLSEILKGDNTGEKIGKLLFFSTIGSFMGSIITSTVLFSTIGVEKASVFNSFLLSLVVIILTVTYYKKINKYVITGTAIFIFTIIILFTKQPTFPGLIFEQSNSYHNIIIYDNNNQQRIFSQNEAYSSGIDLSIKESFFKYIQELKKQIIHNTYENILVIGAAGFTLPHELSKNDKIKNIDVVDVDASLKDISEKYFLEEKLSDKITFYGQPSRFFINNAIKKQKKYDAIIIDVYVGKSLPQQSLTIEFFNNLQVIGEDIYINMITDTELKSNFTHNILTTLQNVFGNIYYKNVNSGLGYKSNFIITNKEIQGYIQFISDTTYEVYTDNKNTIEIDLFKMNSK